MGRADDYQYDYLEDNGRFADQVNGALFHGRQVVRPDELEPADARMVYLGKEAGRRADITAIVDKARIWKGKVIHILAVENQLYVDYHMVLRNMLSESLNYHRQWKRKKAGHDREKDLKGSKDEFLSGMRKGEKFLPVITLVVYCGTEHPWDGARRLHDLLDMDDEIKEFIPDYRMNLYDCHEHDTFEEYHTGLRQLFETVRYSGDKEKLKRIMEENREAYSSIDSETRELLEAVAKVKIPENSKKEEEDGKVEFDMCKAFEDYRLEGKMEGKIEGKLEGRQEHLIEMVCKKLLKNKPASMIADELEEKPEEIERIIAAQKEAGNYDAGQIYKVLNGGTAEAAVPLT